MQQQAGSGGEAVFEPEDRAGLPGGVAERGAAWEGAGGELAPPLVRSLRLVNFVLLEEAEVSFGPGLTVVTGETGAGKSLLLSALGLVAGGRCGAEVIRAGADEAVVEASLHGSELLRERAESLGLPWLGSEVSVRRVLSRAGRSKVHVNGALVTVGLLERLLQGVLDVAGQHEHLELLEPSEQLAILDRFGQLERAGGPRLAHARAHQARVELEERLRSAVGEAGARRAEWLSFQLEELERLRPRPGEDVELEVERRRLASGERLRLGVAQALEALQGAPGDALEALGRARHRLAELERLDARLEAPRARLAAAAAELEEGTLALERYLAALEVHPQRLAEVEERLDALRRLCKRHGCALELVLQRQAELVAEREALQSLLAGRQALELELSAARSAEEATCAALSAARTQAAARLRATVQRSLKKLGLPHALFDVRLEPAAPGPSGADQVTLLFSANAGEPARPLARVASGGEASRLMLAIKAALGALQRCGCSVLDEADAGVGGATADVVGRVIRELSRSRQVLCITHLPQVAAHADAHLTLTKSTERGRTTSTLSTLRTAHARAEELARMISGVQVSAPARAQARTLLRQARGPVLPEGRLARRALGGDLQAS